MAEYKCPALVDCPRADAHEIFDLPPADEHTCPQCGTKLVAARPTTGGITQPVGKSSTLVVAIVVGLVAVAGGGWVLTRPSATSIAEPIPASAPPVLASNPMPVPGAVASVGLAPTEQEVQALRKQGEDSLVKGDAAAAEQAANQAAANELMKLAISKMSQGKLEDAEKDLISAREKDPKQSLAYYNMAILRLRQARTDDAIKEFEASFMAGFSHFKEMDQDKDLEMIRKDPRFSELVARYRGAAK